MTHYVTQKSVTQKGNVLVQMLFAIVLVAAFFLFCRWYLERSEPSLPPIEADPIEETPVEPVPEPTPEPAPEPEPAPAPEPEPEPTPAPEPAPEPEPAPTGDLTDAAGDIFSYMPVGDLLPGSGPGLVDETIYRPELLFPTEDRVFLNSQVYRNGGLHGPLNGFTGGHCNAANYQYPWQDNFCEKRSRTQPICEGGGHEGVDIRPATCTRNIHWVVSVGDGLVTDIRKHWVTIQSPDGAIFNYLHMNMSDLAVSLGQAVNRGDRIGRISSDFVDRNGNTVQTTTHLHFEMYENYVAEPGDEPLFTKVNPYVTLVNAYERKLREEAP